MIVSKKSLVEFHDVRDKNDDYNICQTQQNKNITLSFNQWLFLQQMIDD